MRSIAGLALFLGIFGLSGAMVAAQELENAGPDDSAILDPGLGPVTHLPVPRFVSLKTAEGNVRRGPSTEHRIDWVFTHRGMPLKLTAEFEHWRRVEDNEGQGGWIYYTMLSGVRTVLVTESQTELHLGPGEKTGVVALADEDVIGRLGACTKDWCEVDAGGQSGWIEKTHLWGVDPDETRE